MNIFFLDRYPHVAARYHCDKHVVKMIIETAQLLSTAHRVLDGDNYADSHGLYKRTHENHPCAMWARASMWNYRWLWSLLSGLCAEYTLRYGKTHATERMLDSLRLQPHNIPVGYAVDPPQCMPDEYKHLSAVSAYRAFYSGDKRRFAAWNHGPKPDWWEDAPCS